MSRLFFLVLLAASAAFLVAATGNAAKPQHAGGDHAFSWQLTNLDIAGDVEQQPGVVNSDGCLWDIDDNWRMGDGGNLGAGEVASASQCLVADGAYHLTGVSVEALSPQLKVTVGYEPQAVVFTLTPEQIDRRLWRYLGCVTGPLYGNWPALPVIEGSNGGHGLVTTVTVTVENLSDRPARDVAAMLELGSDSPGHRQDYCRAKSPPFEQGGAVWSTGL